MANKGNIKLFSEDFSMEKLLQFAKTLGGSIIINKMNTKDFVFQNGGLYIFCFYKEKDRMLHMELGGDTTTESWTFFKDIFKKFIDSFSNIIIYLSTAIIFDHHFLQKKKYLFEYIFSLEYSYATIGFYLDSQKQCEFLLGEFESVSIQNAFYQEHNEFIINSTGNIFKLKKHYNFNGFYLQLDLENFNQNKFMKISKLMLKYSMEQISIATDYKIEKQDYEIVLNGRVW